jgi:hypothetical protein
MFERTEMSYTAQTVSMPLLQWGEDTDQNHKSPGQVHVKLSVSVSVKAQHDVLGILRGQMLPGGAVSSKLDDALREFALEAATQFHLMLTGSWYVLGAFQVSSV